MGRALKSDSLWGFPDKSGQPYTPYPSISKISDIGIIPEMFYSVPFFLLGHIDNFFILTCLLVVEEKTEVIAQLTDDVIRSYGSKTSKNSFLTSFKVNFRPQGVIFRPPSNVHLLLHFLRRIRI